MKPIEFQRRLASLASSALALGWLVSGCGTKPAAALGLSSPVYTPNNFFGERGRLPQELRRVAVLPISGGTQGDFVSGRESLQPVLETELARCKRFELVWIPAEKLLIWTGRASWSALEPLPPKLVSALRDQLSCDGILFTELTRYRAYPPLAVGWNLKLLDLKSTQILWSADEVFDANDSQVANGACAYQRKHSSLPGRLADARSILISPTTFGQYTVEALVTHLPPR